MADSPDSAPAVTARWHRPRLTHSRIEAAAALTALIFTALVTGYRVSVARGARYPGHADPAFTYGVAQNIHAGRGANIDYVWHFLVPGTPLHHYAFDYWLPLPSQLMALALSLGHGLPAALDMNLAMVVLMGVGTYALARSFSSVAWVPAASVMVMQVQEGLSSFALQAESSVYLGAFAIAALAAASYARRRVALWPLAGVFAAFAAMSRSEGLLLCVVIGIAALRWDEVSRWYIRAGLLLAGYLPVSAPYLLTNLSHFGSPVPPAATSFPFITSYENLFSPHVDHSLKALLGGSLKQFALLRLNAVNLQLSAAFTTVTPIVSVLVLMLIGGAVFASFRGGYPGSSRLRDLLIPRSGWLAPAGFLLVAFLFDALVAPVVASAGAVPKLMVTGVPILVVAAMVQLGRARLHPALTALCCIVLLGYPMLSLGYHARTTVRINNHFGEITATLIEPLQREQDCLGRPVVLMTRTPWEANQVIGVAAVQMPNGSLADILKVAQQYGVTDIDHPSRRLNARQMAEVLSDGGPFVRSAAFGSREVYRIRSTTSGARC